MSAVLASARTTARVRTTSLSSIENRVARLLVCALFISAFGLLVGTNAVLVGDVSVLLLATTFTLLRGSEHAYFPVLAGLLYFLVVMYIVSAFGPNFPGWYPALLGLRKALPPWILLVVGAAWPCNRVRLIGRLVTLVLLICSACLLLHNAAPGLEAAVTRSAGTYTSLYAGKPRLQGMLAGPFHAALAGVVLVVCAVGLPAIWRVRWAQLLSAAVGALVLFQANVRSGWIAAFSGLLVVIALRPTRRGLPRAMRVVMLIGALSAAVLTNLQSLLLRNNAALESLTHWRTDTRLLNRLETYRQAGALIRQRPLTGWGPGSAADTLGRYFENGVHVTAHNMFLAYAVEAGVAAALIVVVMLLVAGSALLRASQDSAVAVTGLGLLAALVVFGATGTAVDAAPISWILLLVVGLAFGSSGGVPASRDGNTRARPRVSVS
jgi:O-antigen ligase